MNESETLDYSYADSPVLIVAATENHVIFKHCTEFEKDVFGDKPHILDRRWVDDKWTSFDDLIALASPEHQQMLREIWSEKAV